MSALGLDLAGSYINDYREGPKTCLTDMARDLAAGGWAQELIENYIAVFEGYVFDGDPYIDLKPSGIAGQKSENTAEDGAYPAFPQRKPNLVHSNP